MPLIKCYRRLKDLEIGFPIKTGGKVLKFIGKLSRILVFAI